MYMWVCPLFLPSCPPLCSDVKLSEHPSAENPSGQHKQHPQQHQPEGLPRATLWRQKHSSDGQPHERKGWSEPHPVQDIEGPPRKKLCTHKRELSPDREEPHSSSSSERERSRPYPVQDTAGPPRKRPLESRHTEVGGRRSEVDHIHKTRRHVYEGGHGSAAYDDSNDHYFYDRKETIAEHGWDSYYDEEHYRTSPRHARSPMARYFGPSKGHSLRQPWEHSGEYWDQHGDQYAYRDSRHLYNRNPTPKGRRSQFDASSWYQKY